MKVGDIVHYQDRSWKVSSCNRDYGTCVLVSFRTPEGSDSGVTCIEVAATTEVEHLFDTTKWPFAVIPTKPFKSGRIIEVRRRGVVLCPMVDWVPSDLFRAGGALFFNPVLGISTGELLVAQHERGLMTRVPITRAFGTGRQRQHRKANPWKPKALVTVYDRLMGRSPFDDDDEDM